MTTDLVMRERSQSIAAAELEEAAAALNHVLATGDLSKLTDSQRAAHYKRTCMSLGLNELSRPFDWLMLQGKLVFYPNKSCAEQLRRQHQISVKVTRREIAGDLFVCEVEGRTPSGRTDEASKYVTLRDGRGAKLTGTDLANAFAKAETGAKRRLVLSMIGLSSPPDPEETRGARFVTVDGNGRILDNPTAEQKALAADPRMARTIGEPVFEDADVEQGNTVSQAVRPDELEQPRRPAGPRPSFRASEEDIRRWCGAWFAIVDETPWDTKEARSRFVSDFTQDWPEAKRTDSMRTMFARCAEPEARDFLAKIRAVVAVWKEGQAAEERGDPELGADVGMTPVTAAEEVVRQEGARSYEDLFPDDEVPAAPAGVTPTVHAAAQLTGAPRAPEREEEATLDRLDPNRTHSRAELFELYEQWSAKMKSLDATWRPDDVKRLPDGALRTTVRDLIAQAVDLEEYLSTIGDDPDDETGGAAD